MLASGGNGQVHFNSVENGTNTKKKKEGLLNGWRNVRSEGSQQANGNIQKGQMLENRTHQNGQLCAQLSEPNGSLSPRIGGGGTSPALSKGQRIRQEMFGLIIGKIKVGKWGNLLNI